MTNTQSAKLEKLVSVSKKYKIASPVDEVYAFTKGMLRIHNLSVFPELTDAILEANQENYFWNQAQGGIYE